MRKEKRELLGWHPEVVVAVVVVTVAVVEDAGA